MILNANGSKMRARKRIEFNVPHEAGDGKLKVLVVFSHGFRGMPPMAHKCVRKRALHGASLVYSNAPSIEQGRAMNH